MRGEYDDIGFPAPSSHVYVGVHPVRRYLMVDGVKQWEKLCPGCGAWKSDTEYWSDRSLRTRCYCKVCSKFGPIRDLE